MHSLLYVFVLCVCKFYLVSSTSPLPSICPEIVSRARWGARAPLQVDYNIVPIENAIIHHTVTQSCTTEEKCAELLRNIQNFHMEKLEFHDIGYSFMIGGDGRVYEGVGWHKVGAHTRGFNTRSLGIAFIGTYDSQLPNKKQRQAAKDFLQCAVELGELSKDFKLLGARQVGATNSPGLKLYREIQNWPHYTRTPPT